MQRPGRNLRWDLCRSRLRPKILGARRSRAWSCPAESTLYGRVRRLNCQKILTRRRQYLTTTGRNRHYVLDPDAPFAGEVYSRLDRDDHPRSQNLLLPIGNSGDLVNLEPDTV